MTPLTIVILTKDEELNLAACLASVEGVSDDIHVLDSGSTDRTIEIARAHGASVHRHDFVSFGEQRNWAIDHIPHRHPWVFHLDADERFTPQLTREIADVLVRSPAEAGFFIPSKLMLGDYWLRYSGEYPAFQVRLFHKDRLRYVELGHGQRELTEGRLGTLQSPYLHYPFTRGLEHWFQKHARYARLEAEKHIDRNGGLLRDLKSILCGPAVERRRAAKSLSYRLPARGTLRMFQLLVVKRGVLDGRAGIAFARMKAIYESMASTYMFAEKIGITIHPVTASSEL